MEAFPGNLLEEPHLIYIHITVYIYIYMIAYVM